MGQIDTTRALERTGFAERIHAVAVTGNFFADLGVAPLLGRVLGSRDDHVAVLSYACWSRSFRRDPKVIGQAIRLQGHAYTIIGVTPEAFTGTTIDSSPNLWMPFVNERDFSSTHDPNLDRYVIEIIARLRPGTSVAQGQMETAASWGKYMQEAGLNNPGDYKGLKRGRLRFNRLHMEYRRFGTNRRRLSYYFYRVLRFCCLWSARTLEVFCFPELQLVSERRWCASHWAEAEGEFSANRW